MASNEDAPAVSTYRDYDPEAAAKAVAEAAKKSSAPVKSADVKKEN